jgi:hypothetical protein
MLSSYQRQFSFELMYLQSTPNEPKTFTPMRHVIKYVEVFLLTLLCHCIITIALYSQVADSSANTTISQHPKVFFPSAQKAWTVHYGFGLAVTTLPRDIVEEEINRAPFLDFYGRMDMPYNFILSGRFNTMILTNHATLGLQWSYSLGRLTASLGTQAEGLYGFINITGFDNSIRAWYVSPFVSVGWDFSDFTVTLRAERMNLQDEKTFAGEVDVTKSRNRSVATTFSAIVEQPLAGNTHCAIGVKLHYATFLYHSWVAFSTFNRPLFAPEVSFAIIW